MREFITLIMEIVRGLLQGVVMGLICVLAWIMLFRAFGWKGSLW